MDARLTFLSCLLIGSASIAQSKPDVTPTTPPTPAPDAPQDPGQVKPKKSAGDVISELTREKERLQSEIAYAKARAASAKQDLVVKLGRRGQELNSIAFEQPKVAPQVRAPVRHARVMNDAERETHGADVLMLVNGEAIRRGQFEELTTYLRTADAQADKNMQSQRVIFELIRVTAIAAAFPENAAEGRMADVLGAIQQGKPVTELAAAVGTVRGAQPDGTIEVTRNSHLGTKFEQVAFAVEPGKSSRPFRSAEGFVILQVLERKQNDAGQDVVKVAAVQIPYEASPDEMQRAQMEAANGQIDILVRDTGVLELLPMFYRPQTAPVAPGTEQLEMMSKALEQLDAEIQRLQSEGDKADAKVQARLQALMTQRTQLATTVAAARQQALIDADSGTEDAKSGKGQVEKLDDVTPGEIKPPVKKQ